MADLPCICGQMRAIGKQFVVFGRTLRHGRIACQRPCGRELEDSTRGHTERCELLGTDALVKPIQFRIAQGLHPHRLPTRTRRELPPGGRQLFVHKQRLAAGAAEWGKGLIPYCRKAARIGLHAHHTLPP